MGLIILALLLPLIKSNLKAKEDKQSHSMRPKPRRTQSLPHDLAFIPKQVRHLQATHSPEFLGLRFTDTVGLLKESSSSSDLEIRVWPQRQSFNDHDFGPVPSKWKMNQTTESDGDGEYEADSDGGDVACGCNFAEAG